MKPELDREKLRNDFEISLLFPGDDKPKTGPGCLKRNGNGGYDSPTINSAWLGYQMCAKYAHALLERYNPDRSMPVGFLNQVAEGIGKPANAHNDERFAKRLTELARAVLKAAGESPA